MLKRFLLCLLILGYLPLNALRGEFLFIDDFPQEISADPLVDWVLDDGTFLAVENGRMILTGDTCCVLANVDGLTVLDNISVRARARLAEGGSVGIIAREHWALVGNNASIGRLGVGAGIAPAPVPAPLDPMANEFLIQFDVIGDEYSLTVWEPGQPMPSEPTNRVIDEEPGNGDFSVGLGAASSIFPAGEPLEAIFDFIQVADRPIVTGDTNQNGGLDAEDITELSSAIRAGNQLSLYDVNADQLVNDGDHTHWIKVERGTWFGDANLDGLFDSADLVAVFQAGEFEDGVPNNSTWATGDWNGDGEFESGDFVVAFSDGGFEAGPFRASIVPEPNLSLVLCGLLILGVVKACRA